MRAPAGVLAAAVLMSVPARAEDTDGLQSLLSQTVVTTASTTAQNASTAPATSVTITAEDIRRYGIRSIAEAIDFLGLGVMTSDPLRTPDVGSRGVILPGDDGKHFLLLVNGHSMNDPLYGAARFDQGAGVPIDVVDHIEVILGPGSVLYGSNAMMGVVNVITKNARQYRGGHVTGEIEPGRTGSAGAGTGFTLELGSTDLEVVSAVEYFERFGSDLEIEERPYPPYGAIGGLTQFRRGGPADGIFGGAIESAHFVQAPSGLLRLRLGEVELGVHASAYRRGIPYTTQGLGVDYDDAESFEMDRALRLDLRHQATLSSLLSLSSRAYGDGFDYEREVNREAFTGCLRDSFETCTYRDIGVARWAGIEERLSFNWREDMSLVTMLGVDARYRWVSAKQDAIDFQTREPFAPTAGHIPGDDAFILSPYVEQVWAPSLLLNLNAGARLDLDDRVAPVVSPRGAVALRPARNTTFRGIYSQAFRAPTWSETDLANYRVAPSADVKPETVRSVEASVEQRVATQRFLFGVFRSWWTNMIEATALPLDELTDFQRRGVLPITATNLVYSRNVATIHNYGWNGGWEGSLATGRLMYAVNATAAYTRREAGETVVPLVLAPQLFGNARVAYEVGGNVPTPALSARYVGPRLADRASSDADDAQTAAALTEIRLTLSGAVPGLAGLGYRATGAVTTTRYGAYLAGPTRYGNDRATDLPGVPVDRFAAFVSLRYDFLTGAEQGGEAP